MAPASAPVLLRAAAAALLMALSVAAAAALSGPPAPIIGQHGCSTTCCNVSVPYPFGFGPSHCYWPGLNLSCDTASHPPRLLLGDGSLRVTEIFISNNTVRVVSTGSVINGTSNFTTPSWNVSFGRAFTEHGYLLSSGNELVVSGCNVTAMLSADIVADDGEETTKIVSACASFCANNSDHEMGAITDKYCTGTSGCCLAPLCEHKVEKYPCDSVCDE